MRMYGEKSQQRKTPILIHLPIRHLNPPLWHRRYPRRLKRFPRQLPATQPRLPAQSSEGDLKELVLKAGNEGLDAKEISRRFHISIDLVTLMLKMAKKQ